MNRPNKGLNKKKTIKIIDGVEKEIEEDDSADV
jgi:hypothetical protein